MNIFGYYITNEKSIPSDWKKEKLKKVSKEIITGKTPSTKKDMYWNGDINFITIPDMHNKIFISDTERKLSDKCLVDFKNKVIPPFSVIVSCIATVGLVSINTEKSFTNQQINSIIFDDINLTIFYYEYLKLKSDDLKILGAGGSATLNINKELFSNIDVYMPSKETIEYFSNKVKNTFELILKIYNENIKLNELKQLYLKKFFG